MPLFLLFLNIALVVAIVALSNRANRRPTMLALDLPVAALLADVLSGDERKIVSAAALAAREPVNYQPALASMISLVPTAPARARLALLWAIRAILQTRPALWGLCWRDSSPDVRAAVVSSIARTGIGNEDRSSPSAAHIIEAAAGDPDPRVRRAAYAKLSVAPADRAMPLIWRGLDDEDDDVQRLAYASLSACADATSIGKVVERLSRATPSESRRILQALALMDSGILDTLMRMAFDSPAKIQQAALRAVGAVGVPTTCGALLPLLHDANPNTRRATAATVAEIARIAAGRGIHAAVLDALIAQFQRETEARVVLALIDALEACSRPEALAAVLEKLPALNASVRERGLEAIAVLQRRSAVREAVSTRQLVPRTH